MRSAHVVITTFGSLGDLFPFLAIGQVLKARGHRITVATHLMHQQAVEQAGLFFADGSAMPTPEDRAAFTAKAFHPQRGPRFVVHDLAACDTPQSYAMLQTICADADVLLTSSLAFGAQILAEQKRAKGKFLWISAILAPASFISSFDPPTTGMTWVDTVARRSPRNVNALRRLMRIMTYEWTAPVRRFRRKLGLKATSLAGDPFYEGQHAPSAVLALFSPMMSSKQVDWPTQTVLTGFARYKQPMVPLDPALAAFLRNGDAPLVFTLGSAAIHIGVTFLRASAQVAIKLNRRAVLFVGSPEVRAKLPQDLPPTIHLVEYAPHAQVFPHASVLIHHGGIGTSAEALLAGRPMLVVPHGFDQFDNGERLRRLGVAEVLASKHYGEAAAALVIDKLLSDSRYLARAQACAAKVCTEDGATVAANVIEEAYWPRS